MDMKQVENEIKRSANNGTLQTIAVFLFFLSIVLLNQISNFLVVGFYYLSALFAFAVALCGDGKKLYLSKVVAAFAALIVVSGVINVIYPGNSTINKQLFTIVSVGIALVFLNVQVDKRVYLLMLLLNAAIVIIRVLLNGARGMIYVSSSVNFVSVHLLCPAVLFYSESERRGDKILLWPAVVTWVLCMVVQGRAGILFSSFFLLGLLFLRFFPAFLQLEKRKRLIFAGVLAGIILVLIVLAIAFDVLHTIPIFDRFAQFGLGGNGRGSIWGDYLRNSFTTFGNLLFSPNMGTIQRVVNHDGNLHNSFLNIHAYNGLIMFVAVIALCVNATIKGIKNKKWVYLLCFATFCMRGFTDYVFWGSTGTPFLFYFMFMPFISNTEKNTWVIEIDKVLAFLKSKKDVLMEKLSAKRQSKKQSIQKENRK